MSAVLPPLPPLPVQPQTAALTALVAGPLPEGLTTLTPGTLFQVLVAGQKGPAGLAVTSDFGAFDLKLRGGVQPPAGAVLQMQATGGESGVPVFRIVAINGRPLLPGGVLAPPTAPGMAMPTPAPAAATAAPMAAATPQSGGMAAGQSATAAPGLGPPVPAPPGLTALVLRPASAGVAAGTPAFAQGQPPAGVAADLPVGSALPVRIAAVAPAGSSPPSAAPPMAAVAPAAVAPGGSPAPLPTTAVQTPPQLHGIVAGHGGANQALVQTPAGLLSLPASPATLPIGAAVTLEVLGPPLPAATAIAAAPAGLGPAGWPALTEAAATLAQSDPQAAEHLMRAIPHAGPRLAAAMSVFAGALRAGDSRLVFGEGVGKALDRAGRRDLADKLKGDLDKLSAEAGRGEGGEWNAYTMPFSHGGEIEPIRLLVRRPPGEVDEDGGNTGGSGGGESRFVVEVRLSRLGRLQLDGLVAREAHRFDLIIRTDRPLPEVVRRTILGLFADTAETVGTKGSVSFQAGGRFVDIIPVEAPPSTRILA
ncbi:MAG: DNA polymerase III [Magnetospirillum sp.]|nr:DNA polymerase III [Magnetospirillum sp.]